MSMLRAFSQKILVLWSVVVCSYVQAGQLAIVIDDIGYRHEDEAIYSMTKAISVAIIPAAPHARERDLQASQQGRDVLIHMPMQPQAQMRIEAGGLTLGMDQAEVERRVAIAKQIVEHAIGMNNHMGSAATADVTLMQSLMHTLSLHNLSFLDSRTIGRSVAGHIAKQYGIPTLERHIFLDASDELADVQHQFQLAIQYARKHGVAVVIGHPRKHTIQVLQSELAHLPTDIQLVNIGSLWKNQSVLQPKPFIYLFSSQPSPSSKAPFLYLPLLRGVPN